MWTEFKKDTTISTSDIKANFDHVAAGHILPRQGSSMSATTSSLDLGGADDRYDTIYCNNLNFTGEIRQAWNLISEVTLNETATAIEFKNMNGDKDEIYNLLVFSKVDSTVGTAQLRMVFNNDSAANYGHQYIRADAGAASAARATGSFIMVHDVAEFSTTATKAYAEFYIYAKTGHERTLLKKSINHAGSTYIRRIDLYGYIWNNTSDTITSIKLYGNTSTQLVTNTNIQLWALVQTITARTIDPTTT